MTNWRPVDEETRQELVAWLRATSEHDFSSGFDATGWEAATWILHSIYEVPNAGSEMTHDDLRRQRAAAGLEEPDIIGDVNLDEITTTVGNSLGMSGPIGVGWVRLRWHDLAGRLSIGLGHSEVPPCHRWFPYRSWPVALHPPDEGSLDRESLGALVALLAQHSIDGRATRCVAYYSPLACGEFDAPWMREFQLVPRQATFASLMA